MRAALVLALLAGSARAGDFIELPSRMTPLRELPKRARLVETRAIAGLGQVWRYAVAGEPDTIVLAADGAWWVAPPVILAGSSGLGGSHDDVDAFRTRLAVRTIDGRVGVAITVEARSRACFGRSDDTCEEGTPVAATLVCTRAAEISCQLVATE